MLQPGDGERTVRAFFHAYLVRRSLEETVGCLCDCIQWVGTGVSEYVVGKQAALRALEDEFAQVPGPCSIAFSTVEEHLASPYCAAVLCRLRVCDADDRAFEVRVSAACVPEAQACKIASIHASMAADSQPVGEYFPVTTADTAAGPDVENRISRKAADILGKSIPGGMMGGYLEPGFPLYYVNERMLTHLGYGSRAEYETAIGGLVLNCMHPDDRERVDREVAQAFAGDREYEVRYRIRRRDGSYLWVNDIGKKGVAEDGRGVCISVLRDVTAEMEAREKLLGDAAEKERQARRYNRLFQSVLCGIVQYQLDGEGRVHFKNANREAIRIFGYTEEEFWHKRDWDLPLLIACEDRERVLEEVSSLHRPGDKKAFEYRLLQRGGGELWIVGSAEIILDADGDEVLQSVFLDIDSRKKAELKNRRLTEQLEASNEILKLALEHTTTCEFYYYPQIDLCVVPDRTGQYYGTGHRYSDMPRSFAEEKVDAAYHADFCGMYRSIRDNAKSASAEFRMKDGRWCRQTMTVLSYSEDARPYCVVGIVEDITREREMERALDQARSRDSLTGLYNREAGVRLAQEYLDRLEPEESCTLMLLDMDDFERINQEEGSVFADAILQEVADLLVAETGPEDYQIRLGGDEFMLFVKSCDKARATVLGPRIAEQVKGIMLHTEKDIYVSVSIGMCATIVVDEYSALYRCAESTLKYVKAHNKGCAACYLDTSNELGVYLTQVYTERHPLNAIDRKSARKEEDLAAFALELLGKSQNLNDAVFLLLARVGKNLGLDRVTIVEADREYLAFHYAYQWARDRTQLQLGQEHYVTPEVFERARSLYDKSGLICCSGNTYEAFEMLPSCLHAGIWNCGEYAGSMSFECAKPDYPWSEAQRQLLQELVRIVPSFLMKAKADAVSRAKTDFLSRMSHEIRTPMNAISGMTTIAKSVLEDRKKTLECLEKIEWANHYLLELVNDVLDMSRIESGKLELHLAGMDFQKQSADFEAMMQPQAQAKSIAFTLKNGFVENRPLSADALRLNQVMVNIVGNAIKFTDSGGRVEVELAPTVYRQGGVSIRFSVRDTGIGIEKAALARIFNPFEQAEPGTASRHGGTGLGLSISSRLVQMMGGTLEVKSQVGVGSEFYFTLTFSYASGEAGRDAPGYGAAAPVDFTGKRLLLAEDNELNMEIARTILEMNGFCVEAAADGRRALECFTARPAGYYDAILMDIRMPVMDGLESARRIRTLGRADSRTIPILALTANAFDEDTRKSMESGMNGHLSKPIQVDKLLELLSRWLNEEEKSCD